jgi:hypothetical protein
LRARDRWSLWTSIGTFTWYEKVANRWAQFRAASLFLAGIPRNLTAAATLFKKVATQVCSRRTELRYHVKVRGRPKRPALVRQWYQRSAARGNPLGRYCRPVSCREQDPGWQSVSLILLHRVTVNLRVRCGTNVNGHHLDLIGHSYRSATMGSILAARRAGR